MSEFALIQKYFMRPNKRGDVLLGVGDDAAVLQIPPDKRLVAAVDTIVEGVHFPVNTDPAAIGYRALAVNLSDMSAMGATPAWATLSLSLPEADSKWLEQFSSGFYGLADRFAVSLVGGDTVRGPLSATVSIMGFVESDRWLTRGGASAGDTIFVSGVPGEAAAGLALVQRGIEDSTAAKELLHRFLWPEPRIELGRIIRPLASAAIDISDGLLADLEHICNASRCGARIDFESLPFSSATGALFDENDRARFALAGGDDYELLFTVSPENILEIEAAIAGGVRCTPIGRMTEMGSLVCYRGGEPQLIPSRGYDHFA